MKCHSPFVILFILVFTSFVGYAQETSAVDRYYQRNKGNASPSSFTGSVNGGKLINGKLMPFSGANYQYFDSASYLGGRGYMHNKVRDVVLASYKDFEKLKPTKRFFIMESANKEGGRLFPHRTHQTGMSVDFMTPLLKNGKPYSALDTIGIGHYFLQFNNNGQYIDDPTITIDFNLVAQHILQLNKNAQAQGLKVNKVIFKIELKDELFATPYGKQLKASGIYVVKALSSQVNEAHDDHYHIDFTLL